MEAGKGGDEPGIPCVRKLGSDQRMMMMLEEQKSWLPKVPTGSIWHHFVIKIGDNNMDYKIE